MNASLFINFDFPCMPYLYESSTPLCVSFCHIFVINIHTIRHYYHYLLFSMLRCASLRLLLFAWYNTWNARPLEIILIRHLSPLPLSHLQSFSRLHIYSIFYFFYFYCYFLLFFILKKTELSKRFIPAKSKEYTLQHCILQSFYLFTHSHFYVLIF